MPFLILKALGPAIDLPVSDGGGAVAPGEKTDTAAADFSSAGPALEPQSDPVMEPLVETVHGDLIRLGLTERVDEARRYAALGKAMRLVDPERPHEAHLVGADLADPATWRHTLLIDDEPFTDQEFDRAEAAFLSALQAGAVPASSDREPAGAVFDLDQPLGFDA